MEQRAARIYSIFDIHGRLDLLKSLMEKLYADGMDFSIDKLIFIGDYVDRGPDSKGVIEYVRELQSKHPKNVICLKGNHEALMLQALRGGKFSQVNDWLYPGNGGGATLRSFGGGLDRVPEDVLVWLESLPLYHVEDGFFFSHAPIGKDEHRPEVFAQREGISDTELLWSRPGFDKEVDAGRWNKKTPSESDFARDFTTETGEKVVGVCGHYTQFHKGEPFDKPRIFDHYIYGDTGSGKWEEAPLSAVECVSKRVFQAQGSYDIKPKRDTDFEKKVILDEIDKLDAEADLTGKSDSKDLGI